MNYAQFLLFLCYFLSLVFSGAWAYSLLSRGEIRLNRVVCFGELLLLGSISLIGQLFILSFLHLYKNPYLWGLVFLNYAFILDKNTRRLIGEISRFNFKLGIPESAFALLLSVLIFRNLYFLIDVDSLSTYLLTQRIWVESGTSLIGKPTNDIRIFVPQFDAIPYSLGISVFGHETLFPQLIGLLWRIIAVLLVFGYTKYRLNGYYALAASAFVVLNDHFFYSGANQWVIINAAVIALIFAAVYNFWEARMKNSDSFLVLALIFLSQLLANKYYLCFVFLSLLFIGLLIQHRPLGSIKRIIKNKKYAFIILLSFLLASFWYMKNFIITGDPVFPLLAGKFNSFGWTQEQQKVFAQLLGTHSAFKLIKYISFLFIWPGVNPAKYVLISMLIFPCLVFVITVKKKIDSSETAELCFWLSVCILILFSLCLATWEDPRIYRFLIGLFSFTTVLMLRFILKHLFNLKNEIISAGLILILSMQGYTIINKGGVIVNRPTVKENIDTALNRIHMDYIIRKHQPEVFTILEKIKANQDKFSSSAWFMDDITGGFLLPDSPGVSIYFTSTIKWESYAQEVSVIEDLKKNGIQWVMVFKKNNLTFLPIEEFSKLAVQFERFPKKTLFDYGFPEELTRIRYK